MGEGVPEDDFIEGAVSLLGGEPGDSASGARHLGDADKATDFGTAFHRLAQLAVIARAPNEKLVCPAADRMAACARSCRLDQQGSARLAAALSRWFASAEARRMAAFSDLRAEVPFFVTVDSACAQAGGDGHLTPDADCGAPDASVGSVGRAGRPGDTGAQAAGEPAATSAGASAGTDRSGSSFYLEGEIDLLALSPDGLRARVVDYKTGGRADESAAALARKHVLQACCYAYALIKQGVEEVDAVFVRVEQPQPSHGIDAPSRTAGADEAHEEGREEPQRVCYRFERKDEPVLAAAIADACRRSVR